jgi:hypothetical protein
MSFETEKALRRLDYNFLYLAVYVLFIVFIIAEMSPYPVQISVFGSETTRMEFLVYFTITLYFIVLILIQFESLKTLGWWLTFVYMFIIYFLDLCFFATK